MFEITVLFNDTAKLDETMREAFAYEREGISWHLVYAASNRPQRLKRWVSHGGWDRLTAERARKLAQPVAERLSAMRGSQVHVIAARGEAQAFARDYMQQHNLQHLIDARAARFDAEREQGAEAKPWVLRSV
jgi:hypothetical protein